MGVNKIVYNGVALIDITGISVTADTLAEGVIAMDATGAIIYGNAKLSPQQSSTTENGVRGISKVVFGGRVLFDATALTVTPGTLLQGVTAINAAGRIITGTAKSCTAIVGEAIAGVAIVGVDPRDW